MRLSVLLWLLLPFLLLACEEDEDTDGDGINDRDDACPEQEEDNRWSFEDESDGCPDGLDDLARLAEFDIDGFWERTSQNFQLPYEGPDEVVAYTDGVDTPCGAAVPNNAFYCALDHRIYYHEPFIDRQLEQIGDFAVVFVLAHEWGHLMQANLGLLTEDTFTIALELQADCLAGAYTADADKRGLLEQGDTDEGVVTLINSGDPAGVPWFHPAAHGSPEQRVSAFRAGYQGGIEACLPQS